MTHTATNLQPSAFYQWLESKLQSFVPLLIFYPNWTQHNRMVVIYKALNDLYHWDKCTMHSLKKAVINDDVDAWEYEAFHSILIDWIMLKDAWLSNLANTKKVVNCAFCGSVLNKDNVELYDIEDSYKADSENEHCAIRSVLIGDVSNVIVANIKYIKRKDGLSFFEVTSGEAVGMAVDEDIAIGEMLSSNKPCLKASYPSIGENWITDIQLSN